MYAGGPPWDIGAPQPAFAALAQTGAMRGRVLDIGCGTGEHTLLAAAHGLDATGIDLADGALRMAESKAQERGLTARFLRLDALRVADLGESFDTALDSLVLHAFTPADRAAYLDGLRSVLRPGGRLLLLCYSNLHTAEPDVPHKLSREDLESAFADGWALDFVQAAVSASNIHADGVTAWLAVCTRL
ncbi:class I SAM-dependent methyltransferase [Actinomadura sp. NPDC048394]|uniref:class I SAM-dependent methyltransferase n=1 Tax=Actinomadura sp. NPDC048394 TaxID=3158223 RepID=UPI0033C3912E